VKKLLSSALASFGFARLIIVAFLIVLVIGAAVLGIPLGPLLSNALVRTGMNGIFVLAMLPTIISGIGPNFGLPLGILCGLVGGLLAIELDMRGFPAFFLAVTVGIPLSATVGAIYGWLLNKVKGSEMMVSTYVGFSFVSLMNIGWIIMPFASPEMVWPIGRGLRVTISLADRFASVLDQFWAFQIFGVVVPTGLLLAFSLMCVLMWLFVRSKAGMAMKAVGDSRQFALASGINVDKYRLLSAVLSTVLGAVGIVVFSQSFTFLQLYEAPMGMGFPAAAAILIGGATVRRANILNVILGVFLFQSLLVVSLPVINKVIMVGGVAEIARIIVSNGIILYALAQVSRGD